jgi:hypothetical protein
VLLDNHHLLVQLDRLVLQDLQVLLARQVQDQQDRLVQLVQLDLQQQLTLTNTF